MAYLNTVSTDFFWEDLQSGKFTLIKNQGVGNYVDYEAYGVFTGRGALRFEDYIYPSTPQRIFRILAPPLVFPPLQIQDGALKLSQTNEWSAKEVRVKVLVRGESGSDGILLINLGGSSTNRIIFVIGRIMNVMGTQIALEGVSSHFSTPIFFGLNSWYLVDFQAKVNFFSNQILFKNVVYPVNLNADGTFNSLGAPVDDQGLVISLESIPSPDTLWGVNPVEVQGVNGNLVRIWLDNLSIGQGEGITEL